MASIIKRERNKKNPFAVRYRDAAGRQREEAFPTMREAKDHMVKLEHDQRSGTFIDPERGQVAFAQYAAGVVERQKLSEGSRKLYNGILNVWVGPWANGRSLSQVAEDREGVSTLVNVAMRDLSYNRRGTAQTVILKAVNEAVAAGRITSHRLSDIDLIEDDTFPKPDESFVFPTFAQVTQLADTLNGYGIAVWLMRACGLRVGEALAVERADFTAGGTKLKLARQASDDGLKAIPLKARKPGQYRIIPVPAHLWAMVRELPEGTLCQSHTDAPYITYNTFYRRFMKCASEAGIPAGFTPHSLRHAFATALLERGSSLPAVSKWLGHADTSFTARKYHHVLKSSEDDARELLDSEFEGWRK